MGLHMKNDLSLDKTKSGGISGQDTDISEGSDKYEREENPVDHFLKKLYEPLKVIDDQESTENEEEDDELENVRDYHLKHLKLFKI